MMHISYNNLLVSFAVVLISNSNGLSTESENDDIIAKEEIEAEKYLKEIESEISELCYKDMEGQFNYAADISETTKQAKAVATKGFSEFEAKVRVELHQKFPNWRKYKNDRVRYQLHSAGINPYIRPKEVFEKYVAMQSDLAEKQSSATICDMQNQTKCDLRLVPDISQIMRSNPTIEESEFYITEWFNKVGNIITPEMYAKFINISNELAKAQGYPDLKTSWLEGYHDRTANWSAELFRNELEKLMEDIKPYFNKIHAFVRLMLKERDQEAAAKITEDGLIPLSVINSLWGHDWSLIADKTMPFPQSDVNTEADVTKAMKDAGFTPHRIVEKAEKFFTGLDPNWKMPTVFWEKSLFERPTGREAQCHPAAFDFCKDNDMRVQMCLVVTEKNLLTAFHEFGHLVYFKSYSHLPFYFRNGANPGFHEAVGDTIALSVTPQHLKCHLNLSLPSSDWIDCEKSKILTHKYEINEIDINDLYIKALHKVCNLPYTYAVQLWRRKVYKGDLSPSEYNLEYWKIRKELSGLVPPKPRGPETLDIATLYHIVMNEGYINYFVSGILQFQFYEALCIAAGQYSPDNELSQPLHRCDFGDNREAGKKLQHMLSKGASEDWRTVLEEFTGSRVMTIDPMVRYFKPLFDYIDTVLEKNNVPACFGENCNRKE